jgi:hypothetical protein
MHSISSVKAFGFRRGIHRIPALSFIRLVADGCVLAGDVVGVVFGRRCAQRYSPG